MKRRSLFTSVAIAGVVALVGCSNNQSEPEPSPSVTSSPSASESPVGSESEKATDSDVDSDLRKQVDLIVVDSISAKADAIDDAAIIMKRADKYLDEHEGSPADETDNPFTTLENFSNETNEALFEIYSKDSKLLKYFDLTGLKPNEEAAIALWSQSMPLIFSSGEIIIPSEAFVSDGKNAQVDLSKGAVTTKVGQGSLIARSQELGKLPMTKVDGEWLINSKEYYKQLEQIND